MKTQENQRFSVAQKSKGFFRKIILLLILISLTQIVLADTINKGESTYANGKTVTLVGVSSNSVVVSVDGVKNIISLNDEKEINGITIKVISIFYFNEDSGSAELELSGADSTSDEEKKPVCGDGECNGNEDSISCCKDCGCKYGFGCENDKCVKAECLKDIECYASPKDYCSLDKCDPISKKCTHKPITDCVVNDKCCPTLCYYPDDTDCPTTKLNPNPQAKQEAINGNEVTGEGATVSNEEVQELSEKVGFFKKIINWFLGLFSKK